MATEILGSRLNRIIYEIVHGKESVVDKSNERKRRRKQQREDIREKALTSLESHPETDPDMFARAARAHGFAFKDATKAVEFVHAGQSVGIAFARYGFWDSPFEIQESRKILAIIAYPGGTEVSVRLFEIEKTVGRGYGKAPLVVRDHTMSIVSDDYLATMHGVATLLHQALESGQTRIEL